MGNRDRRDDKIRKPKKDVKPGAVRIEVPDSPPPVEVVKKKRRKEDL